MKYTELADNEEFYHKVEYYNKARTEKLSYHYKEILKLLGEDPEREGLVKTPYRVAKAMQFMTRGYTESPEEILRSALFKEDYRQMVIVKDIEIYSLCPCRRVQTDELRNHRSCRHHCPRSERTQNVG